MNANPGVDVTYDPTGSGAGITGASEGTLDIGLSSRALKEDETGLVGQGTHERFLVENEKFQSKANAKKG